MSPEPRRVVDGEPGPARLRVQAARGAQVPQRRPVHRRGREVQLPSGQGRPRSCTRRSRRSTVVGPHARALHAARAVAGLHDVLRHAGLRRGLDRAEEVRGAGGRRRLQEAPDRARPLQVREPHARRRAGDGGQRGLLAQDAVGEAAGLQERARERRRAWPCSSAARSTSPTCSTCPRRRRSSAIPTSSWRSPAASRSSSSTSSTSGTRSRRGTTGACGWPPTTPSTARR